MPSAFGARRANATMSTTAAATAGIQGSSPTTSSGSRARVTTPATRSRIGSDTAGGAASGYVFGRRRRKTTVSTITETAIAMSADGPSSTRNATGS